MIRHRWKLKCHKKVREAFAVTEGRFILSDGNTFNVIKK